MPWMLFRPFLVLAVLPVAASSFRDPRAGDCPICLSRRGTNCGQAARKGAFNFVFFGKPDSLPDWMLSQRLEKQPTCNTGT
jgi:hypothetical protein